MRSEIWHEVDRLVAHALELPLVQHTPFLDEACRENPELRREVEKLLAADANAGDFLERPLAVLPALQEAAEPPETKRLETKRLGPYRLLGVLGEGGMSVVYRARRDDGLYQQEVAVKVLAHGLSSPELKNRFRLERQVLASLEHPSIARLYDAGSTGDGWPYLVMEKVDGLPIDAYCDRHRLSVDQRLGLFRRVCAAVDHAHRHLLIHRDLKPANILVTAQGEPKLLDFGIAKPLDAERLEVTVQKTRTGLRPMTLRWASPEQVRGESLTTASDTFTLGVILYHLLTGRGPYRLERDFPHEVERAILEQEPWAPSEAVARADASDDGAPAMAEVARARRTSPRELHRRLRGDLDTIVGKALRKEPSRRYGTARELSDDLERHLTHQPVAARPDAWSYRLGKLVRRNALAVGAASLLTVLLLAFTTIVSLQSNELAAQRDLARLEMTKAEQISGFLKELLAESDPSQGEGGQVTVREVLDRGAARLVELADQPELQADLMITIGQVYRSLGLSTEALGLMERALELDCATHDAPHEKIAQSLNELAGVLQDRGDYEAAERAFRESLSMTRELFGDRDSRVGGPLNNLALALHERGEYRTAESLYLEAFEIAQEHFGETHSTTRDTMANLALLYHEMGEYEAAAPWYRRSLEVERQIYGDKHPSIATLLNNYGGFLQDLGDYGGARESFEQSLELRRELFGDEHPAVAIVLTNLGDLYAEQDDHATAEPLYREAGAMGRRVYGGPHWRIANADTGLARLLLATGRAAEAEGLVRSALAVYGSTFPEDHWRVARAQSVLGGVLDELGAGEEAEGLLVASFPILRAAIGDREPMTHDALRLIVRHYVRRGRTEEAAEYRALLETLAGTKEETPP